MTEKHEIKGYSVPTFLVETKKKKEADFAICTECEAQFDKFGAPWPMAKSMSLHEKGLGHKKFLMLTFKEKGKENVR